MKAFIAFGHEKYSISFLYKFESLCSYQFHSKPSPLGANPQDTTRSGQKPSPGIIIVYKTPPSGQNGESNTPPLGHKVEKFHKCIYKLSLTLFEMKSFVVSTNKTVFQ